MDLETGRRKFRALYSKNFSESIMGDQKLSLETLVDTHVFVRSVVAQDLEEAYMFMQGEVWSPHGEGRLLIRELGLKHTSMSVGDVLHDEQEDKYFKVQNTGWEEIKPES